MSEPARDIVRVTPRPTARQIIAEVAQRYGLTVDDMIGRSRRKAISHPRQEAMWEVRHRTTRSLLQMGRIFHRDHTTILSGIRAYERRRAEARERAA